MKRGRGCKDCVRFGYHPLFLAFLLTLSYALSIGSSLDCIFLIVDVGFVPRNAYTYDLSGKSKLGVGIWSYAGRTGDENTAVNTGCVKFSSASQEGGGVSLDDDYYERSMWNDDWRWAVSRIIAICGMSVGLLVVVAIWWSVNDRKPMISYFVTIGTIVVFACEGVKFGLFCGISPCSAIDYWYDEQDGRFHGAEQCNVGRGGYMSLTSTVLYFLAMILSSGYVLRPVMNHDDDEWKEKEEVNLDDLEGYSYE